MKLKKFRPRHIRCKDCFWECSCAVRKEQDTDPVYCTDYLYSPSTAPAKPNFWLYLAGDLAYCFVALLAAWLGLKYDSAALFFIAGAFSVFGSNLNYDYHQRLREYNRWCLEKQKQEELDYS